MAKNGTTMRAITVLEQKFLDIVKEAKMTGITVNEAAKKLYGKKRMAQIARPNQALHFKIENINLKLAHQKKGFRIKKKNPGPGPGKQIVLVLSRTA